GRKRWFVFAAFLLLVVLEQGIKLIIKAHYMNYDKKLIWDFLHFKPLINDKLSWINSSLSLGLGFITQVTINILAILIINFFYRYYASLRGRTVFGTTAFVIINAGAFCSLIDKIFWGGSLDYIKYTGLLGGYTFDLKDCYITVFEVMFVLGFILNMLKDRSYNKFLGSMTFKKFMLFIRDDIEAVFKRS
ncbi:MAG: signal peptidase II, partial [Bacillota bacterium]|nr:signal peptidase II [Bacillota bacterium]